MENLKQYLKGENWKQKKIKKKIKETLRNNYNYKLIKELLREKEFWNLL
jgi:hypothetical protein